MDHRSLNRLRSAVALAGAAVQHAWEVGVLPRHVAAIERALEEMGAVSTFRLPRLMAQAVENFRLAVRACGLLAHPPRRPHGPQVQHESETIRRMLAGLELNGARVDHAARSRALARLPETRYVTSSMPSAERPSPATPLTEETAGREVLAWLREEHRNPLFLAGHATTQVETAQSAIVERFFSWAVADGFTGTLHEATEGPRPDFAWHWTYRDSELIGFKQPPAASTPEQARLLGCAALLRNEWCRRRLT